MLQKLSKYSAWIHNVMLFICSKDGASLVFWSKHVLFVWK